MFFDFVGILPEDTMINRSKAFCEKSNSDKWMGIWLHSTISTATKGKSGGKGNNRRDHEKQIPGRKAIL
jgi:hypothetical protein